MQCAVLGLRLIQLLATLLVLTQLPSGSREARTMDRPIGTRHRAVYRAGNSVNKTSSHSQVAVPHEVEDDGCYRIRSYDFQRVNLARIGFSTT